MPSASISTRRSARWFSERWFALTTDQAIRRGSFDSVRQLEKAITKYLAAWSEDAKRFRWTKSASQIRWRIRRAQDIFDVQQ